MIKKVDIMKIKLDKLVKIDSRERKRIKPSMDYFYDWKVCKLDTCDFVYDDKVGIEYKRVDTDLFSSIINKRLFNQVGRMVQTYPIHYLLIEGNPWEYLENNDNEYVNFNTEQWDGTYTSLQQVTQISFCKDFTHGLQIMSLLFKKSLDNKNRVYNYIDKFDNVAVNFLMCKLGIGQNTAETVANELNLSCWEDLNLLDKDLLMSVDGIGEKKAQLIMNSIKGSV